MSLHRLAGRINRIGGGQTICNSLFVRAMTTAADVESKLRDKLKAQDVVRAFPAS